MTHLAYSLHYHSCKPNGHEFTAGRLGAIIPNERRYTMAWNLMKRRNDHDVFGALQRQINSVFDDLWGTNDDHFVRSEFIPRMDVKESANKITVKADLPGMEQNDIDVEIKDPVLTIKGERKEEKESDEERGHIREMSYGMFQRSISLPDGIKPEQIKATYKNGTLIVEIPKDEKKAPKQIEVKVN